MNSQEYKLLYDKTIKENNIKLQKDLKQICDNYKNDPDNKLYKKGDMIRSVLGILLIKTVKCEYTNFFGFTVTYSGIKYKKDKGKYIKCKDQSFNSHQHIGYITLLDKSEINIIE